ncbi:hypothetical protein KIH87_02950 [Paraneptunicella aestuarii]|uniref:permease prefix domain 2-containing transporter n=1 Tax=Paraneptunicella aestuarii TaxID=2831148 RepID=UPI001E63F106|nr:permease prefix domain 2-containing transporter [Paraneptunicella aestuarii]UAA39339.1 hypothetical protein KIH87_02950 [Paraneptunicella aestuarii]
MKEVTRSTRQPPRLASRFLEWALPDYLVEPVLGDLSEEYFQRLTSQDEGTKGAHAALWYWRQAIKSGCYFLFQTQRGLLMFIFSVLLFLGFMYLAMFLSGGVDLFINVPSFLVVFPAAIAFTYGATSVQSVSKAFSILLSGSTLEDAQTYRQSKRVFGILGNSAMLIGFFMTLLGWVAMAASVQDIKILGLSLAVSLLALLYALGLKVLCFVAEHKIQSLSEE